MMARRKTSVTKAELVPAIDYEGLVERISELLERSQRGAVRAVDRIRTATYWQVGCYIVEYEQGGKERAAYGEALLARLAIDLTARRGRGYSERNLRQFRALYLGWEICQTASGIFEARAILRDAPVSGTRSTPSGESSSPCAESTCEIPQAPSAEFPSANPDVTRTTKETRRRRQTLSAEFASAGSDVKTSSVEAGRTARTPSAPSDFRRVPSPDFAALLGAFPLSWSHYVRLMSVKKPHARAFYEAEAIRGGWSVRQLGRQVGTQFFERVAASKRPEAMLRRARTPDPRDAVSVRDELHDPYLLEFLQLKDEYSESDLEEAIIHRLEWFLLEMGFGFTFVARQKRIRIGDEWYRIDLLLYHRVLRCLVIVDLKRGPFTHADAGQMNLYLNYAREHLTLEGEQDPVGLILCSDKNDAVVKYATGGIRTQVFASKYLTALPDEETLRREILATQRALEYRAAARRGQR